MLKPLKRFDIDYKASYICEVIKKAKNMTYFNNCQNLDQLRSAYRELAKQRLRRWER